MNYGFSQKKYMGTCPSTYSILVVLLGSKAFLGDSFSYCGTSYRLQYTAQLCRNMQEEQPQLCSNNAHIAPPHFRKPPPHVQPSLLQLPPLVCRYRLGLTSIASCCRSLRECFWGSPPYLAPKSSLATGWPDATRVECWYCSANATCD